MLIILKIGYCELQINSQFYYVRASCAQIGVFMKYKLKSTDLLIGLLFTLFLISAGVVFTINFRPLYYFDIDYLNIVEKSGFDKETIIKNYNALIHYSSPFFTGKLTFPTLAASDSGLFHFVEVKRIFNAFFYTFVSTMIALIPIILYKHKKKDTSYLKVSSIVAVVLPTIVGLGCAINFDRAFVIFHKIFFRNDYWLFDPATDPVITILPDTFFLHSAVLIIAFVLIGSLCLYLIATHLQKRRT